MSEKFRTFAGVSVQYRPAYTELLRVRTRPPPALLKKANKQIAMPFSQYVQTQFLPHILSNLVQKANTNLYK